MGLIDRLRLVVKNLRTLATRDIEMDNYLVRAGLSELKNYQKRVTYVEYDMKMVLDRVKDLTATDVDLNLKGASTVIVTGRFKGGDLVQVFNIGPDDFNQIVEQLRHLNRTSRLRHVDVAPQVRGVFNVERSKW